MDTVWMKEEEIYKAAELLKRGEVVSFPTETVYGLGADATNDAAVKKIYAAKGRPSDNPLIIHIANLAQVSEYAQDISEKARIVMEKFWPGPCTIVLRKRGPLAETVTAGLDTVGIRMPDHPIALKLIEISGIPLAAPSANSSGRPSPTSAEHVYHDLNGKIAGIIDGGETGIGLESTVLDLSDSSKPVILRPGGISKEALEAVIGPVMFKPELSNQTDVPMAPGMKYTHYSPSEPVVIVAENGIGWEKAIRYYENKGEVIGLLASEEIIKEFKSAHNCSFSLGKKRDTASASKRLFKGLRYFEETKATVILAESYSRIGIGEAYMNRLEKAAGNKVI